MYIQQMFIARLGAQLKNFRQRKPREWTWSHSCETQIGNKKLPTRAGIFPNKDGTGFIMHCHHCGASMSFLNFLKDTSPNLYDDYRLEKYRTSEQPVLTVPKPIEVPLLDINLNGLIPVTSLPETSSVVKFLQDRKIPEKHFKLFYVAPKFFKWASRYKPEFKDSKNDAPRLIIPYFDLHGRVFGFTCRSFDPNDSKRYLHLRLDPNCDFVYGTERIDPKKTIYVTEGQIDSLFISNAVAVGGANYESAFMKSIQTNSVIIPDSDWKRNKQVGKQLMKAVKLGFKVFFVPDSVEGKDINDFICNGMSVHELQSMIEANTKSGLQAQLEFGLSKRY